MSRFENTLRWDHVMDVWRIICEREDEGADQFNQPYVCGVIFEGKLKNRA